MKRIGLRIGSHKLLLIDNKAKNRKYQRQYEIFEKICSHYGFTQKQVLESGRKRPFVTIRQLTMYALHKKLPLCYREIGGFFKQDHATAIHAKNLIENLLAHNKEFKEKNKKFITDLIKN